MKSMSPSAGIASRGDARASPLGPPIKTELPLTEESARKLKAGDIVELSGEVLCMRDMLHKHYFEHPDAGPQPCGSIYHCGPIVVRGKEGYRFLSAGPTTSSRMERFLPALIRRFGIRAVIGKGGLDRSSLEVLKEAGCVYFSATGGAGSLIASKIVQVREAHFLELGTTEALWDITVEGLPAIVTMDTHMRSIHHEILEKSRERERWMYMKDH